ncbi:zinc metalloprotease [Stakelama tenebrarum]|uniref:Peptidase M50 domain-containing protein n=1 Tax=Stakelama tenebrarum TaxID=2711215 RepID=A0A6G6Y374_9SPHN|nr:hypothetical protein [Sphingosinithalassobacter tenebrarum]QIG79168.1 hypothetical protein G5C33_04770 [Sphingosinithalassobacter tenebrarum]
MIQFGIRFFLILVLTFVVHEAAHALAGLAMGFPVEIGLNHVRPVGAVPPDATQAMLISAAGPAVTVAIALIALATMRNSVTGFLIILAAFLCRAMASVVSLWNANDEMRISESLGIGAWTLPIAVTLLLGVLVWLAAKGKPFAARHWRVLYYSGSLGLAAVVGADMVLPRLTIG